MSSKSVDGFVQRPTQVIARKPLRRTPQPRPIARRAYAVPQPTAPHKKRLPVWIQTPLLIAVAMLAGVFAESAMFGQLVIVSYGLAALIWGISSRTTFTLALIALMATIALLVGRGNVALAQSFATYTFLLLVAGVITLGRELKKEGGRVYSIRERNINNW